MYHNQHDNGAAGHRDCRESVGKREPDQELVLVGQGSPAEDRGSTPGGGFESGAVSGRVTDQREIYHTYVVAGAFCEGHKPHPHGRYNGCLICALNEYQGALMSIEKALASPERVRQDTEDVGGFVSTLHLTHTPSSLAEALVGKIKALKEKP